jgi:hypothetical protein
MGAGAGAGAIGAFREQSAENAAIEYTSGLLETNSKTRELQAINAEKIGAIKKSELKSQVNLLAGAQRAAFGASGAVVDEGSAFDVTQATEIMGVQDAMTLEYNTAQEAFGLRAEAADLRAQAAGLRMRKGSPELAAGMSLLGSGTQIGSLLAFGGGA